MSNIFSEDVIGVIVFGALLLSMLAEAILSGTWNKWYLTSGLPLFIMRIPVNLRYTNIPLPHQFEEKFRSSLTYSLVFKEIEPNTYGFFENCWEFRIGRYSPLMRGLLFFDFVNNQVVVKGFANWSVLLFSLTWLGVVFIGFMQFPRANWIALAFISFFALVLGILYWIQYYRFSQVAMFAAEKWASKHARDESILDFVRKLGSR